MKSIELFLETIDTYLKEKDFDGAINRCKPCFSDITLLNIKQYNEKFLAFLEKVHFLVEALQTSKNFFNDIREIYYEISLILINLAIDKKENIVLNALIQFNYLAGINYLKQGNNKEGLDWLINSLYWAEIYQANTDTNTVDKFTKKIIYAIGHGISVLQYDINFSVKNYSLSELTANNLLVILIEKQKQNEKTLREYLIELLNDLFVKDDHNPALRNFLSTYILPIMPIIVELKKDELFKIIMTIVRKCMSDDYKYTSTKNTLNALITKINYIKDKKTFSDLTIPTQSDWYTLRTELQQQRSKFMLREITCDSYKKHLQSVIASLIKLVYAQKGAPNDFEFCILGIGSFSREDFSCYSDLDVAILTTDVSTQSRKYLSDLIESLNSYLELLGFYLFESDARVKKLTFIGHKIDDSYVNRLLLEEGKTVDSQILVNTPNNMANWVIKHIIKDDVYAGEQTGFAYALLRPTLIYASKQGGQLIQLYHADLNQALLKVYQDTGHTTHFVIGKTLLQKTQLKNQKNFDFDSGLIDLKEQYITPILNYCLNMSLLLGHFEDKEGSKNNCLIKDVPNILLRLKNNNLFPAYFIDALERAWLFLQGLRKKSLQQRPGPKDLFLVKEDTALQDRHAAKLLIGQHWQILTEIELFELKLISIFLLNTINKLSQTAYLDTAITLTNLAESNFRLDNSIDSVFAKNNSFLKQLINHLIAKHASIAEYSYYYQMLPELPKLAETCHKAYYQELKLTLSSSSYSKEDIKAILQSIATIPCSNGWRAIMLEKQEALLTAISSLSSNTSYALSISAELTYFSNMQKSITLNKAVIERLLTIIDDKTLTVKIPDKKNHKHAVLRLETSIDNQAIYFKFVPDMPLMDYFIDNLQTRLIGHGTIATTLAKLTIENSKGLKEEIPILIAVEVIGTNLANLIEQKYITHQSCWENQAFSELLMMQWLLNPGDNSARNFIVINVDTAYPHLVCIDNEIYFVVPTVKNTLLQTKVNLQSILLCFDQAKEPISELALAGLRRFNILQLVTDSLEETLQQEHNYNSLFSLVMQKKWYKPKDNKNVGMMPFILRENALFELINNLCFLKAQALVLKQTNSKITIFDVMDKRASYYYQNTLETNIDILKRFYKATAAKTESLSNIESLRAQLNRNPTEEEIFIEKKFGLSQAFSVIKALELAEIKLDNLTFSPIQHKQSKRYKLSVDFSKFSNKTPQQQKLLFNILSEYSLHSLTIKNSDVLDDNLLIQILSNNVGMLAKLHIHNCSVGDKSINYIFQYCTNLKELTFDGTEIRNLYSTIINAWWIHVPTITALTLSNNSKLELAYFKAPQLKKLIINQCPNLKKFDLAKCANLTYLDLSGCNKLTMLKIKSKNLTALQQLIVNNCLTLEMIAINASALNEIMAKNCSNLTHIKLPSHNIKKLDLQNCSKITYDGLANFISSNSIIQFLNLNGCSQFKFADFYQKYPFILKINLSEHSATTVNQLINAIENANKKFATLIKNEILQAQILSLAENWTFFKKDLNKLLLIKWGIELALRFPLFNYILSNIASYFPFNIKELLSHIHESLADINQLTEFNIDGIKNLESLLKMVFSRIKEPLEETNIDFNTLIISLITSKAETAVILCLLIALAIKLHPDLDQIKQPFLEQLSQIFNDSRATPDVKFFASYIVLGFGSKDQNFLSFFMKYILQAIEKEEDLFFLNFSFLFDPLSLPKLFLNELAVKLNSNGLRFKVKLGIYALLAAEGYHENLFIQSILLELKSCLNSNKDFETYLLFVYVLNICFLEPKFMLQVIKQLLLKEDLGITMEIILVILSMLSGMIDNKDINVILRILKNQDPESIELMMLVFMLGIKFPSHIGEFTMLYNNNKNNNLLTANNIKFLIKSLLGQTSRVELYLFIKNKSISDYNFIAENLGYYLLASSFLKQDFQELTTIAEFLLKDVEKKYQLTDENNILLANAVTLQRKALTPLSTSILLNARNNYLVEFTLKALNYPQQLKTADILSYVVNPIRSHKFLFLKYITGGDVNFLSITLFMLFNPGVVLQFNGIKTLIEEKFSDWALSVRPIKALLDKAKIEINKDEEVRVIFTDIQDCKHFVDELLKIGLDNPLMPKQQRPVKELTASSNADAAAQGFYATLTAAELKKLQQLEPIAAIFGFDNGNIDKRIAIKIFSWLDKKTLHQIVPKVNKQWHSIHQEIKTDEKRTYFFHRKSTIKLNGAANNQSTVANSSALLFQSKAEILTDTATSFDDALEQAKQDSLLLVKEQRIVGPRFISGWHLQDVKDDGNCFYLSVVDQLRLLNHDFLSKIPEGTASNDSLRLLIQGNAFKDSVWASDNEIESTAKKLNVIVAIVDTRFPDNGFVCYYQNNQGNFIINTTEELTLPAKPIIRLAATGNHFLSVRSHPALTSGGYQALPFNNTLEHSLKSFSYS